MKELISQSQSARKGGLFVALTNMLAWTVRSWRIVGSGGGRDLGRYSVKATGRQGLPAEAVLRCALLKQYRQLRYPELAFHLEDSASFRAFARLPWSCCRQKSVLQKTISAIRPETWEEINRALLLSARQARLGDGSVVPVGQHRHRSTDP